MKWISRAADAVLERLAPSQTAEGACMAACGNIARCFMTPCDDTYNGLFQHCTSGACNEYWLLIRCGC